MRRLLSLALAMVLIAAFSAPAFAAPSPQIEPAPPQVERIIEEYQTIYHLTVHYIYIDGRTAAPDHLETLLAGVPYGVSSPHIQGYRATTYLVSGVMPARDIEYTVIYIPGISDDPDVPVSYFTIEDYETPLGFAASFMHVGVSVE